MNRLFPRLILGLIIVATVWSATTYIGQSDEGLFLSSAMKIAHGQVMYRDFFEFWTPGSITVLALAFRAFGASWLVVRTFYEITIIAILLLGFSLLKRLNLSEWWALVPVSIFAINTFFVPQFNHHWLGWVGLLIIAHLLISFEARPALRIVIIAGLMAGLTTWLIQYEGAAAVVGGSMFLWQFSSHRSLKNTGLYLLGVVIFWLPVGTYYLIQQAAAQALFDTVIFPFTGYHATNGKIPDFFWLVQVSLLMVVFWYMRTKKLFTPNLKIAWCLAIPLELISGLTAAGHVVMSSLLTHGLCVVALADVWPRLMPFRSNFEKVWALPPHKFLLVAFIALCTALDLGAHLGIPAVSGSATLRATQPVSTMAGTIYTVPELKHQIQTIQGFLDTHLASSQTLYIGPYNSTYYFIFGKLNPTGFSQITPGYNSPAMMQQAIHQINHNQIPYLIYLPHQAPFHNTEATLFDQFIKQNYHPYLSLALTNHPAPSSALPDAIWMRNAIPSSH